MRGGLGAGTIKSRARRALLAAIGAAALAGCGFHPLYAPRPEAESGAELASIKVNTIPDRLGQMLAASLRDGLNPTGASAETRYALDVQLNVSRSDIAIRSDATSARSRVTMTANFKLMDTRAGRTVYQGSTRSVSSFDVLNDSYATVVAQQSAEERSVRDISDEILTRLSIYVRDHRVASTQP